MWGVAGCSRAADSLRRGLDNRQAARTIEPVAESFRSPSDAIRHRPQPALRLSRPRLLTLVLIRGMASAQVVYRRRAPMAEKMFRVYSIVPRPKQDDYWLNIGVAFPHDDGKGFNIMLQALPIHGDGKIVMREFDPAKEEQSVQPEAKKR
jgi:hypothetical protein